MSKQMDAAEELALIVAEAGEDFEQALPMLRKSSRVSDIVLRMGYNIALAQQRHENRVRLRSAPARSILVKQMNARRAEAFIESLYTTWDVGKTGKKLGECTKGLLIGAAATERASAEGLLRNVAFYEALIEQMPDGDQTLAEVVPVNVAYDLRAKAFD